MVPSINLSDVIDPITQAIRTEIIVTQQLMLQQAIAKGMNGAERIEFADKNLAKIQKYLKTEDGKEAAAKVMSAPALQTKMHQIESAGYQAVHNKFKASFRDVAWEEPKADQVRSTNITNNEGQEICTLKETTVNAKPAGLNLTNGTVKMVESYRQIDFPKGLKVDHGPLHVSIALKDETGRNMTKKNAVYFTAHYDNSGKLTEVSSPIPVKFMGNDKDAIGYIERNGKAYTLPVTQGKYNEMMKAVTKNNGINADLSHSVEKPASDLVITNKTVPKELAAQVSTLRERVVKSTVTSVGHATTPPIPGKGDKGRGM